MRIFDADVKNDRASPNVKTANGLSWSPRPQTLLTSGGGSARTTPSLRWIRGVTVRVRVNLTSSSSFWGRGASSKLEILPSTQRKNPQDKVLETLLLLKFWQLFPGPWGLWRLMLSNLEACANSQCGYLRVCSRWKKGSCPIALLFDTVELCD